MAYNVVAQVDEVASNSDSNSDLSRSASPIAGHAFQHLCDANHGGAPLEAARNDDNQSLGQLGSMIRSMTTNSYDVSPPHSSAQYGCRATFLLLLLPSRPPLRSASSDLPINHPIPDLQSSQGAYVGNVARLEQSAEQLSSSTADIGCEIRKMDQEQKRRSCSSASNSAVLRNGAFSPATIASHGSTFSTRQRSVSGASRLTRLAEPDDDHDGQFLDRISAPSAIPPSPHAPIYTQPHDLYHNQYNGQNDAAGGIQRPGSAASGDTFLQAQTLFTNFDGVHFAPLELANSGRQLSLSQPPLASKPQSYKEPQRGENMVYYPAPVPRMLNLPPKLSRKPIADREKRRTELLTNIVAEDRKSGSWLAGLEQGKLGESQKDKRQSKIPPQLRASLFFDKPSTTLEVDVKQDSAVATLDSILDASAHAPVSAFTDHPYAGQVGSYVFHQPKRKTLYKDPARQRPERHSQVPMGQRHSTNHDSDEEGSVSSRDRHRNKSHDEHDREQSSGSGSGSGSETEGDEHSSESGEDDEEEEEEYVDYMGPPNTLLAELELRKQELKQRQRTALPTPTQARGMKSTLLELDARAQKQSDKRRRRPVTLAWNNHDTADDDDVPLAMLYPDQINKDDEDRPVGLMERRQLDENEPLSTRRARLRGEPIPEKRPVTVYTTEPPRANAAQAEAESGDETETLAERLRRLRGQNPADSEFASDLFAEFDNRAGVVPKEPETVPNAHENETLAQRRNRLQKQNGPPQGAAKNLHMRRSMAALPQSRPVQQIARQSSHDVLPHSNMMSGQYANRMSMQSRPLNMGHQVPMGYQMGAQPYGYGGMGYPAAHAYNSMMMGVPGGMVYAMPAGCGPNMAGQPVDPVQQEFIDRWRQSIR
ncbi:uncharacterized protein N7482_003793 [Penicillium canariense]|uniref:Uncharacterized protein n=1 Tax=Penicillium canariense TaxID=189055 RepID=A0A9W9I7P0_9EURO|nr:uncharacterized protein N7482_003793 [Penicillium canariense]KAJ5168199.1 hypothetical protein N7482_003793 [Penicillium canariense]